MSTLYALPDEKQHQLIAEERKADALQHWEQVKKYGAMKSVSSMEIGFHAHYIKKNGLFGILGFEDEGQAMKASGVGQSTWFNTIRLAEAFEGLTEDQFTSMKLGNAEALADLPESRRKSREWVREAGADEIDVFRLKVDKELDGKARPSDGKERGVTMKMDMPLSRKTYCQEGLTEYAKEIGITNGDIGKALETLIVEKRNETSLIGSITNAVQRIRDIKALRNSYLSAEECLDRSFAILDEMAIEFAEALKVPNAEEQ